MPAAHPEPAMPSRRHCLATLLLAAGFASAFTAQAQPAYPTAGPIRLVVPFSAGGGTDILARLIANKLETALGQTVVIDNQPGANGAVASENVARKPADGYTLLFGSSSTHAIAPLVSKKVNYDPFRDFAPVTVVANTPLALVVNTASPIQDFPQYLAAARKDKMSYGTFGAGSTPHILGEVLAANANVPLLHVPYKGSAQAVTDILGNHIESAFLTVAAVAKPVSAGKLRALAVSGAARSKAMPTVPTFKELGVAGLEESGWFAIFAPAKTPAAITTQVADAVAKIVAGADVQAKMVELGLEPVGSTPEQHAAIWKRTHETMGAVIRRAKITID
ncbi:MAG: tripartite tricarboxylate transporter substrate binding protein [Betaproteobacteria bacterium]|nr:tripartite tricarboxylate transporter substrate binding protein [Betaproteobacteria bacterium]